MTEAKIRSALAYNKRDRDDALFLLEQGKLDQKSKLDVIATIGIYNTIEDALTAQLTTATESRE
jgi:hypothetical protein